LVAIARRRGQIVDGGIDAALAEVLPTAWTVIRQYPWHRRPNKVASNLVLDSEYFAFVQANRAKKVKMFAVEPSLLSELVAEPETSEFVPQVSLESLINTAISRGIAPRHVAVLRAVANGDTAAVIAKHYGIAERTARAWRAMAISELRARTQCVV
jgi:DNA-binding NarL/FixJ family response regulator